MHLQIIRKFILFLKEQVLSFLKRHVFLMMKLKLSCKCKDVKKRNWVFQLLKTDQSFIQEFPVPWALSYYCVFWTQWKWLWKWLGMQLYKCFCFKRSILHCNAIFSNIALLIFTANREAVFANNFLYGWKKL